MNEISEIYYFKQDDSLIIAIKHLNLMTEYYEYNKINRHWKITATEDIINHQKCIFEILKEKHNSETEQEYIDIWKESYLIRGNELIDKYKLKILLGGLDDNPKRLL